MMQCQKDRISSRDKEIERYVATPEMVAPGIDCGKLRGSKSFVQKHVQKIDLGSGACIMDMHDFIAEYPDVAHKTFGTEAHKKKLHDYAQCNCVYEENLSKRLVERDQICVGGVQASQERDECEYSKKNVLQFRPEPAEIKSQLGQNRPKNQVCVNCAYHRSYVLYVPAGVVLSQAIDLSMVGGCAGYSLREQVIIILGPGASVTVYDYVSNYLQSSQVVERTVSSWIQDGAQITYIYNQQYGEGVKAFTTITGYAHANSTVDVYGLIVGADFSKTVLDVQAVAAGANITTHGLYALSKEQRAQIISCQNHTSPGASSSTTIKALLAGSSNAVFHGTIFIDEQAPNTSATLENKNLLLDQRARAHSMPILQVLNNDVQCAHGSAIGQLDAEQLFYAHARGLDKQAATQLLLQGFIADVLPAHYRENMIECVLNKII